VRHIFIVNDKFIRIVTDAAPSVTLATITKRPSAGWTPSAKSKFVFAFAVGMAHFHSLGVLHGDLDPRNIFLNAKLEPVISSITFEPYWGDWARMIFPDFWAPECLFDERRCSFASDVYSFGMTLYSMFATPWGRYSGQVCRVEMFLASGQHPEWHPTIPEFYWELIESCWSFDPSGRPTFLTILDVFCRHHSYVFDKANVADVLAYETALEPTLSLFVTTGPIKTLRSLSMLIPSLQILKKEAISDSQLFIQFANRADPFLLLPEDTPLSVGATSRDVLLVLGRDQWPAGVTPVRLVRWLLNENDFEKIEQIGDPGRAGPVIAARPSELGSDLHRR
jgi:serine/threonine protein kinase